MIEQHFNVDRMVIVPNGVDQKVSQGQGKSHFVPKAMVVVFVLKRDFGAVVFGHSLQVLDNSLA